MKAATGKVSIAIIYLILVSNMVAAIILSIRNEFTLALAMKDILLSMGIGINIYHFQWSKKYLSGSILFFILYIFSLFPFSSAPVYAKLISIRQFLAPFGILLFGMLTGWANDHKEGLQRVLFSIMYFLLFASAISFLLVGSGLLDLTAYAKVKDLILDYRGVPYMFFDPMTLDWMRNPGPFLDPINWGHTMLFFCIWAYYKWNIRKEFLAILILFFLSSFCKGAFLQALLCIGIIEKQRIPKWIRLSFIPACIVGILFVSRFHDGVLAHVEGLSESFRNINLWGHGLALTGNQAAIFNNTQIQIHIYDTYIGSLIGQLGAIGTILWMVVFGVLLYELRKEKVLFALLLSQLLISALSENAFNFLSVFILLLTSGFTIVQKEAREN